MLNYVVIVHIRKKLYYLYSNIKQSAPNTYLMRRENERKKRQRKHIHTHSGTQNSNNNNNKKNKATETPTTTMRAGKMKIECSVQFIYSFL